MSYQQAEWMPCCFCSAGAGLAMRLAHTVRGGEPRFLLRIHPGFCADLFSGAMVLLLHETPLMRVCAFCGNWQQIWGVWIWLQGLGLEDF
jgi:hypothetical protein